MTYFGKLHDCMNDILQRNVKFVINNKTIREGNLILFNLRDYYIECLFITPADKRKTYEIPIPFDVYKTPKGPIFDYKLRTLIKNNTDDLMCVKLLALKTGKKSKFYDNTLTIEY